MLTPKDWIQSQIPAFTQALEELVNLNTFTHNTSGVDQGMAKLEALAQSMGLRVERIHGRHCLIKAGGGAGMRVLLIAHMDTVHPPDGKFQRYEPQEDGFVRGPGIGDIKGGLLMGVWALHAMQQFQPDCDVRLIVSADEEEGSPTLKDWYLNGAGGAGCALGLEPGFPQGNLTPTATLGVVEARKGCGRIYFALRGKATHAGGAWQEGISAIEGMAQRIIKIHALTDLARGITTNVGLVKGGTAANTVADFCEAAVDFRFLTQADGEAVMQRIEQIINTPAVFNAHVSASEQVETLDLTAYLPPLEKTPANQRLVKIVLEEAARLGQKVVPIMRGGGSDANYVSSGGVPAICGMGAPAEGIHTTHERTLLPLLFERLELLIATIYRLTEM